MTLKIRDDRQCSALTGLPEKKLAFLEQTFTQVYHHHQQTAYEEGVATGKRKRRPGGGRKGALQTMREKLIFLLYYLKVYPTFDVLGTHFSMARSKACENVHKLSPILHETLVRLGVLPERKFTSVEAFRQAMASIEDIIIDVTERSYRRPSDAEEQHEKYSGKKKAYREKYSHCHSG